MDKEAVSDAKAISDPVKRKKMKDMKNLQGPLFKVARKVKRTVDRVVTSSIGFFLFKRLLPLVNIFLQILVVSCDPEGPMPMSALCNEPGLMSRQVGIGIGAAGTLGLSIAFISWICNQYIVPYLKASIEHSKTYHYYKEFNRIIGTQALCETHQEVLKIHSTEQDLMPHRLAWILFLLMIGPPFVPLFMLFAMLFFPWSPLVLKKSPHELFLSNCEVMFPVFLGVTAGPVFVMLTLGGFLSDLKKPWDLHVAYAVIGTSLISCFLAVNHIMDLAVSHRLSKMAAFHELMRVGKGKGTTAPFLVSIRTRKVVDYSWQGKLIDEWVEQIAEALVDNQTLLELHIGPLNGVGVQGGILLGEALLSNQKMVMFNNMKLRALNTDESIWLTPDATRYRLGNSIPTDAEDMTFVEWVLPDRYEKRIRAELDLRLTCMDCAIASQLLMTNPQIRDLDFSSNAIADDGLGVLCDMVGRNTTLVTLRLGGNKITPRGSEMLGKAIARHPTLESVCVSKALLVLDNLKGPYVDCRATSMFQQGIQRLDKIEKAFRAMGLAKEYLGDIGPEYHRLLLEDVIKNHFPFARDFYRTLETEEKDHMLRRLLIKLGHSELVDPGHKLDLHLVRILKPSDWSSIEPRLNPVQITNVDLPIILWMVKTYHVCQEMDLRGNKISDQGAILLANFLKDDVSNTIRVLDLSMNHIGSEDSENALASVGAQALMEAVVFNKTLANLFVTRNVGFANMYEKFGRNMVRDGLTIK